MRMLRARDFVTQTRERPEKAFASCVALMQSFDARHVLAALKREQHFGGQLKNLKRVRLLVGLSLMIVCLNARRRRRSARQDPQETDGHAAANALHARAARGGAAAGRGAASRARAAGGVVPRAAGHAAARRVRGAQQHAGARGDGRHAPRGGDADAGVPEPAGGGAQGGAVGGGGGAGQAQLHRRVREARAARV
ncbi:PE-PGRS family protein [Gracilaria domingensis]|nr:PE-PGRS family protein [Gracilaria domingensis]